jgi:SOS-response transcriptional repressor LexA
VSHDWIQVEGESMRPVLRSGEWIGVRWCKLESGWALEPGDLVLGRGPDEVWLVHRLVRRGASGRVVLKGDASRMSETLPAEEVWGKVVALKSARHGEERRFEAIALDRVIARVSRLRLRRTAYVLGWIRRAML